MRAALKEILDDGSATAYVGLVVKREGESSHYQKTNGEILIEVDLSPEAIPVTAVLTASVGSVGHGVWKIPPVGTEVIVVTPSGDLGECFIVACTATGQVPDDLDETTLVVTNGAKVKLITESDDDSADIEITASGNVKLATSSGKTVQINGTDHKLLRSTDLLADLKTLCQHIATWIPLAVTGIAASPSGTATDPGVATTAGTIVGKINSGNYESTKGTNG